MLEIAADYCPFSNQFQHLADQNPFSMDQSKTSDLKKMATQFLILIGLHPACVIVMDLDTLHQIDYSFNKG